MDKKITGIVSYITIIGWLVAYLAGDKQGAKVPLNQGLVLGGAQFILWLLGGVIGAILGGIPVVGPLVGWLLAGLGFAILLVQIYGIYLVVTDKDLKIPVVGDITLLK